MKDFKLKQEDDGSWDIDNDSGDEVIIEGLEALKQRLRIKLAHIGGEWYLDTSAGGTNYEMLGAKGRDLSIAKRIIREAIESDSEVLRVERIEAQLDNKTRKLSVAFECSTIYGDLSEGVAI